MTAVPQDSVAIKHERTERFFNGVIVVVPLILLLWAAHRAWGGLLHWQDILVFVIMYLITGIGVTVGYHRLLTHRSFKTTRRMRGLLAVLGSAAVEGPVIEWSRPTASTTGSPTSPATRTARTSATAAAGAARSWASATRMSAGRSAAAIGRARSATQRISGRPGRAVRQLDVPDLGRSPAGAVAFGLGVALTGMPARRPDGAAVGRRRADLPAASRDVLHQLAVPLLRPPALRDRRRVAQPRMAGAAVARRGVAQQPPRVPDLGRPRHARWEFDPSALFISGLERIGLAWDVVRITPERRAAKLA